MAKENRSDMKPIIQLSISEVEKIILSEIEVMNPYDEGNYSRAINIETDKVIFQVIISGRNVEVNDPKKPPEIPI